MPDPFASLHEQLLRAGVRPGAVSRYVAELKDHLDDIIAELEAVGVSRTEAKAHALSRLGSVDDLARPMITDRRFHSWAARAPWAVFLFAPVAGHVVITALLAFILASATSPGAVPNWFEAASFVARHFATMVVPLAAAWLLTFTALRQRSQPFWPLLGMGLTIVLATMIEFQVHLPTEDQGGAILLALAAPSAGRMAALLIMAAAPLFILRKAGNDHSIVQADQ